MVWYCFGEAFVKFAVFAKDFTYLCTPPIFGQFFVIFLYIFLLWLSKFSFFFLNSGTQICNNFCRLTILSDFCIFQYPFPILEAWWLLKTCSKFKWKTSLSHTVFIYIQYLFRNRFLILWFFFFTHIYIGGKRKKIEILQLPLEIAS